jgi:hypothetical protein
MVVEENHFTDFPKTCITMFMGQRKLRDFSKCIGGSPSSTCTYNYKFKQQAVNTMDYLILFRKHLNIFVSMPVRSRSRIKSNTTYKLHAHIIPFMPVLENYPSRMKRKIASSEHFNVA